MCITSQTNVLIAYSVNFNRKINTIDIDIDVSKYFLNVFGIM